MNLRLAVRQNQALERHNKNQQKKVAKRWKQADIPDGPAGVSLDLLKGHILKQVSMEQKQESNGKFMANCNSF